MSVCGRKHTTAALIMVWRSAAQAVLDSAPLAPVKSADAMKHETAFSAEIVDHVRGHLLQKKGLDCTPH